MKRFCLISSVAAIASMLAPSAAHAEPYPGVLYIPDAEVTLFPDDLPPCSGGQENSALGCTNVAEESVEAPYADLATLQPIIETEVADFDLMVTNTRPPEYVPYMMLMVSDEVAKKGTSYSCANDNSECSSLKRNPIGFINGGTLNCVDPVIARVALYEVGRMSGLEGNTDVDDDVMAYPPDFTVLGSTSFSDQCNELSTVLNPDTGEPQPQQCTSLDHFGGCDPGQVNSYADMLEFYGPRAAEPDTEAPVIAIATPADGDVFQMGDQLPFTATITDNDTTVAVRWTMESESPAFVEASGDGIFTKCTNDVCDLDFAGFTPTDSDWGFGEVQAPGPGTYTVTLEASDFHGNVAEAVTVTVTVEGDGGTGGNETGGVDESSGGASFTGGATMSTTGGDTSGSDSTAGQDDDGGGCSCSQGSTGSGAAGLGLMFLGLLGLRRRRS